MKNFLLLLSSIYLLSGCNHGSTPEPPVTVSEVLNSYVASAPFQRINIDDVPVQTIHLQRQDFIYSTFVINSESTPQIGQVTDFTYSNNRFYIYDGQSEAIFTITQNGTVSGPFTREGDGPGEHRFAGAIRSNSRYIYLMDINNARLNRYSPEMEVKDALAEFRVASMFSSIALNDDEILFSNQRSGGFSPEDADAGLIVISSIHNLADTTGTMLPRIIPPGYQPNVYNNPFYSINNKGKIVAGYRPLPWIFIYNEEYELEKTLIFDYSVFDEMDIPKMDFFKPIGNEGYGGTMPFSQVKLMDNGDLFLTIQRELIHLRRKNNDEYQIIGKYQFTSEYEESALTVSNIYNSGAENEFYAGNWNYLFRTVLP